MSDVPRESDEDIAASAIRETEAQLEVLRVLAPLDAETRTRIMQAVGHLIAAESHVSGVLAQFVRGGKP